MRDRLRRLVPTREQAAANRWLRWLGPALHHPRLWHISRRGVALGAAIGVFFGFLIPIAQIPFSAATAVVLRANVPAAMVSTLVTNPITFPPVYYAAWRTGTWILGEDELPPMLSESGTVIVEIPPAEGGVLARIWRSITGVGKALLLGLGIFACLFGVLVYMVIHLFWVVKVRRQRRRRRRRPARE